MSGIKRTAWWELDQRRRAEVFRMEHEEAREVAANATVCLIEELIETEPTILRGIGILQ